MPEMSPEYALDKSRWAPAKICRPARQYLPEPNVTDSDKPIAEAPAFSSQHRSTRYGLLAQALAGDIASGRYPVGAVIPTEQVLCQRYAVSRHTVRQALNELKNQGLLSAQAGVGTTVRARPQSARFSSGLGAISELLQFVGETRMRIQSQDEVLADAELAGLLRCEPGQAWREIRCVREMREAGAPIAYVVMYIRAEFVQAIEGFQTFEQPVYAILEEHYGLRIVEVQQSIAAEFLPADMAQALCAEAGSPALQIVRHFSDRDGRVIQTSVGYYPHGRYRQQSTFRASTQGPEAR
ncbi:UTRA domain-containing protein [Xylophilus rhododendri]|uniref:UTRA domain-containing protein n=1 Tax=Xylophilus rhododendri TaxID=2697032 RepID=A0A857J4Q5_9BURK|nr:GntR family transcriptional regulator [Xylophilus rhododendri]QHI97848.1 UTRA domain-containing protein [Xylophilus rhododendri]